MPADPLLPLERVDLNTVLADEHALKQKLKQRGSFWMLDAVHLLDFENGLVAASKEIRADDWWVPDHIPGRPLFPGVLMIESAAQACSYHFCSASAERAQLFVGFAGVDKARFRGSVEPGCTMVFLGKVQRVRSTMFAYQAQGWVEGRMVFEADILGVVL